MSPSATATPTRQRKILRGGEAAGPADGISEALLFVMSDLATCDLMAVEQSALPTPDETLSFLSCLADSGSTSMADFATSYSPSLWGSQSKSLDADLGP